jgi:uncharacterized protein YyaL (SSP411 family)
MVNAMLPQVKRNPAFHANWFELLCQVITGPVEVTIVGAQYLSVLQELKRVFVPDVIWSGSQDGHGLPRARGQFPAGENRIYVCRNNSCYPPVSTIDEALAYLGE